MGHPTNLFSPDPASNYICVICHDVLEDACSVKECGHTFCRGCIKTYLETNNGESCPNCRINISGYIPNYFARDSVDELQVKCFEGACGDDQDNDSSDNGTKKRKRDDGDDKSCNWKGPLKDLKNHKENLCPFKLVTCSVGGCDHTCFRKDMESHISGGFLTHMMLIQRENDKKMKEMVKHVQSECDKKIKSVQSECDKKIKYLEIQMQHSRYIRDCREWLEHKPDALTDFSIYMIRERRGIVGLLCYIPGPKDTAWEGAKIPMLLSYRGGAHQAPNCKFPAGFFHTNVYPSGTVCVSTVNDEDGWSPEMSLPEVLFTVQQLLNHPNPNSRAQAAAYNVYTTEGPELYYRRIKEEANVYSNYSGHHSKVSALLEQGKFDGKIFGYEMEINDLGKMHSGRANANGKSDCKCSCCVLGQTFWDDKKKMRFLFGRG